MGLFGSAPKAPEPQIMPEFRQVAGLAGARGNSILKNPNWTAYGGDWVANMTPEQQAAIQAITSKGMGQDALLGGAQNYAQDVLGGKYLDQENPYLQKTMQSTSDMLGRQIGAQFAGSGMAGSPSHTQYLTEAFSNAAAPLMMQNYQNERNNQATMAGLAPQLSQAGYFGLNQALGAQGQVQAQSQAEIDAQRQAYDFNQTAPLQKLQGVMSAMGGQMSPVMQGGSSGSTGLIPGLIGGGASGAMAGMMTGNPYGVLAGAGLGAAGGGAANK